MIKIRTQLLRRNSICGFRNIFNTYCSNSANHYDIIIAGGGMVGTTMACALATSSKLSDKRILVLEGASDRRYTVTEAYSNRVSALNIQTIKLMKSIGAWDHVQSVRFATVKKMQVWDACSDALITFNDDDLSKNIAYVVENDVILNAVNTVLRDAPNVKIHYSSKITSYSLPIDSLSNQSSLELEDGTKYSCDLLIGADGMHSQVRETMGVHFVSWKYDQRGVVATVDLLDSTSNNVAWQRFLPTGPVALLPLTNNLSSLVWTTTPEHARQLVQMEPDEFVDALNDALLKPEPRTQMVDIVTRTVNSFLEKINLDQNEVRQLPPNISRIHDQSRASFPLGFGHASNYVAPGVALIGDAAHRVHPLAGQGVNLGFGDVTSLAKLIGDAIYSGYEVGNVDHLKEYERQRQMHNVPTALAIDALQKLYGTSFPPVVLLRSVGLQLTHSLLPVKKAIMDHARG